MVKCCCCYHGSYLKAVRTAGEELNRGHGELFHCLSRSAAVALQVYGEYKASLAFDLVSSRQKNVSDADTPHPFDTQTVSTQPRLKTVVYLDPIFTDLLYYDVS